jgi:hypothetical protein
MLTKHVRPHLPRPPTHCCQPISTPRIETPLVLRLRAMIQRPRATREALSMLNARVLAKRRNIVCIQAELAPDHRPPTLVDAMSRVIPVVFCPLIWIAEFLGADFARDFVGIGEEVASHRAVWGDIYAARHNVGREIKIGGEDGDPARVADHAILIEPCGRSVVAGWDKAVARKHGECLLVVRRSASTCAQCRRVVSWGERSVSWTHIRATARCGVPANICKHRSKSELHVENCCPT